jgi:hypothetical protein
MSSGGHGAGNGPKLAAMKLAIGWSMVSIMSIMSHGAKRKSSQLAHVALGWSSSAPMTYGSVRSAKRRAADEEVLLGTGDGFAPWPPIASPSFFVVVRASSGISGPTTSSNRRAVPARTRTRYRAARAAHEQMGTQ